MDTHTLKVLEYGDVLSFLAQHAHSEPGRALALATTPRTDPESVSQECLATSEALRLLDTQTLDLDMVEDTSDVLLRLGPEGVVLEPAQLLSLLQNQKAVRKVKEVLRQVEGDFPCLKTLADGMAGVPDWELRVDESISPKGQIKDSASPALARIRRQIKSARDSVTGRLEEFMRRRTVSRVIREQYVTQRNGRFVIPAKPEYGRVFDGVLQGSSQSGQTVFVEPLFAVDLNNSYSEAAAREEVEIRRVLADLSGEAARHGHLMSANMERLAELDLTLAKARLGARLDGVLPGLTADESVFVQARHPLLALDPDVDCIPIDIAVGGKTRVLVITGPNTGGKTVALKTLGLLTMMVQSGIPVPAGPSSRLRVYRRIFADIGDEQSLSQSLSTFSGHMRVISGLLTDSDADTLVLLDELGAGTDPQEGSALSIALLEALQDTGACVVLTTHHNLLKDFAYRTPYAENASTVFDGETLQPTYRLKMGAPGLSHALEVAGRLGINGQILDRAREIMGSGAARVEDLLGRLSEEVNRESKARTRAEELVDGLEAERLRLRTRKEQLARQSQDMRDSVRREAHALLRDIERRGREVVRSLGDTREEARTNLRESLEEMRDQVQKVLPPPVPRKGRGPVGKGEEVDILSIGMTGTVVDLLPGGQEAEILAGSIRMKVPLADLAPTDAVSPAGEAVPGGTGAVSYEGSSDVPVEINLVGKTVPEALDSVDRVLDRSLLGSGRYLRIVHGKGTGVLRKAVNEALQKDPRVSAFGPAPLNQGGTGVTIVELKD